MGMVRNWWKLLLAGCVAVWVIKNGGGELYRIPAGQMEGTLLEGDNLLVNKWSYGLRLPQTPLALPFFHDSIPGTSLKSYVSWLCIPYCRLFSKGVERNDIVVFNRPDTPNRNIPVDRRKIGVGRCIGLPGDTVCMRDGVLCINGKRVLQPKEVWVAYLTPDSLEPALCSALSGMGIPDPGFEQINGFRIRFFPKYRAEAIVGSTGNGSLLQGIHLKQNNYRVVLPRVNERVTVSRENVHLLYPLLVIHEGIPVTRVGDRLFMGDKVVKSVRFSQPYYWIAGDHRERATDSRLFGAVPHSHLIGKGVAVGYSIDPGRSFLDPLRGDRLLKSIE